MYLICPMEVRPPHLKMIAGLTYVPGGYYFGNVDRNGELFRVHAITLRWLPRLLIESYSIQRYARKIHGHFLSQFEEHRVRTIFIGKTLPRKPCLNWQQSDYSKIQNYWRVATVFPQIGD